jgi:hypothetical protein
VNGRVPIERRHPGHSETHLRNLGSFGIFLGQLFEGFVDDQASVGIGIGGCP